MPLCFAYNNTETLTPTPIKIYGETPKKRERNETTYEMQLVIAVSKYVYIRDTIYLS